MKRVSSCLGLIFWLLTSFTLTSSAQGDPVTFKLKFNIIDELNKPDEPIDIGESNINVIINDHTDEFLGGSKREFDLLIIYYASKRSKFFLGDWISFSIKDNFIRFIDVEGENYFDIFIDKNQVVLLETLNINGKKVERYYAQTKGLEQRENMKIFNILMNKAKNEGFKRYLPICIDPD